MALSVLPGITTVISAQWFPTALWNKNRIHSSCSVHFCFLIFGLRWLCHLSRHYLPTLPGMKLAMHVHFDGPYLWTNPITYLSSSSVQGPNNLLIYQKYRFTSLLVSIKWFFLFILVIYDAKFLRLSMKRLLTKDFFLHFHFTIKF